MRGQARPSDVLICFDLMMHLTSQIKWTSDAAKRLGSPADSSDDHASIAKHLPEKTCFHNDCATRDNGETPGRLT